VLRAACSTVADALDKLDDVQRVSPLLIEVHRLENEGDRIVRGAIASLFVGGIDPTVIIRWKISSRASKTRSTAARRPRTSSRGSPSRSVPVSPRSLNRIFTS